MAFYSSREFESNDGKNSGEENQNCPVEPAKRAQFIIAHVLYQLDAVLQIERQVRDVFLFNVNCSFLDR